MIHCYALSRTAVVPAAPGIDATVPFAVACDGLHAVVSEHGAAPRPTRERALAHAGVVAAVAAETPTVPVRFGVQHDDRDALRAAVAERAERLEEAMRRVGDRWELVVRRAHEATGGPAAVAPAARGEGTDYLRRRLEEEQARRAALAAVQEQLRRVSAPIEELADDVLERDGPRGPERCLLVPAAHRDEAVATARRCLAEHGDVVLGGPWPPYSFAEALA